MQNTAPIKPKNTSHAERIAIFFHDLEIGGAQRVMLQLAQGFMDSGHSVDLVLARAKGPLLSEVPAGACLVDFDTTRPMVMFTKLLKYMRNAEPKALLSPFEVTSVIAIMAKKISRVSTKIIVRVSVNLSQNKRTRWKKIVERMVISMFYPWSDGIVTVSRGVAEDLSTYSRLPLDRIKVIYNPVISDQLIRSMEEPVQFPFFTDESCPVILGVGRLTEQKDFPTLIKAFSIVHRALPSRLVILGDGENRQSLELLIDLLDLKDWVHLAGFELNPYSFMKKASVFVLSSKWEGLPGTLIQALACGCPVVSTDCPSGPSEILKGGEYGHLVPVGDVQAIAAGIEAVLKGNIRKPPQDWLDQFTFSAVIPQYESILGL